jgi:hypothetical protein
MKTGWLHTDKLAEDNASCVSGYHGMKEGEADLDAVKKCNPLYKGLHVFIPSGVGAAK